MNLTTLNIGLALPEIALLVGVSLVLLIDLFVSDEKRDISFGLALLTLLGVAGATLASAPAAVSTALHGMYVADPLASLTKLALIAMVAVVLMYSRSYLRERDLFKGEFFTLMLFALLGMFVMVSANNFLTLYIGLELLSLSVYALIAINREQYLSTEAAMKYFVLGALASGLLLYGFSMLYGATGSLDLQQVAQALASGQANKLLAAFGLVFVVGGLAFKLGAVPFHMWVPDVYQGAPLPMTMFVSSAPKLAAFVFIVRILGQALPSEAVHWQLMLVILAVLSMGLGNITAIAQTNIKRMLAYSTISHMGFLLLGLAAGVEPIMGMADGHVVYKSFAYTDGYSAALFYAVVYGLMSLAGFGLLIVLSRNGVELENLDQLKGLSRRQPWYAFMLLLVMFSMAGIPPLVGFFAKLAVLGSIVAAGYSWAAVAGVLFSLIGAFYYLRIVKLMYFDEAAGEPLPAPTPGNAVLFSINALALLVLGLVPQPLINVLTHALSQSLG